jgi:bifunctional non-homologous end joining protein LigD
VPARRALSPVHAPRLRLDRSLSADPLGCRALPVDATIDGEAVVSDSKGIADFELLHSRENDGAALLWAFDLLQLDGIDLRQRALEERKERLRCLLLPTEAGIHFTEDLAGDGVTIFAHACKLGLEGIVSKDRTRPYRSGPSKTWLKVKNPNAPGTLRFKDR